ncbi:MAG: hypothetical protein HXX20_07830 [Chloroflexi bacterium]|nr:hypothetical protein [Chloroflexota bacterium]
MVQTKPITELISGLESKSRNTPYIFALEKLTDRLKWAYGKLCKPGSDKVVWLLLYLDYQLVWYRYKPDQIIPELAQPEYVQELRLFSQRGEFYLWQTNDKGRKFKARLLLDHKKQSEPSLLPFTADEWQPLWGTKVTLDGPGWSIISEERGATLRLPYEAKESDLPLRVRVRHYLKYHPENGLAYCYDLRLVDIRDRKCQALTWKTVGEEANQC